MLPELITQGRVWTSFYPVWFYWCRFLEIDSLGRASCPNEQWGAGVGIACQNTPPVRPCRLFLDVLSRKVLAGNTHPSFSHEFSNPI